MKTGRKARFFIIFILIIFILSLNFISAFDWVDGTLQNYWSMDDLNENITSKNLTLMNTAVFRTGKLGNGIYFEGSASGSSSSYANITNSKDLILGVQNYTFNAWVNYTATATYGEQWFAKDGAMSLGVTQDKNAEIYIYDGLTTSTTEFVFDGSRWIMMTIVSNGTCVDVYANATKIGQNCYAFGAITSGYYIFGANPLNAGGWLNNMKGVLDEVGIWNRTLNSSEITELYNNGSGLTYKPILDKEYPQFSSYIEGIANNSAYIFNINYTFNITITSTNNSAGFMFNFVNYSASNVANIFMSSIYNLGAGNYNYSWWAYGNGTLTNFNASNVRDYTIAKATLLGNLTSTNGWNINYGLGTTIGVQEGNLGDGDITYKVFRNDIDVGTGAINLSVGNYNYKLNSTAGANYSSSTSMNTTTLIINQIASSINLTLFGNQTNVTINEDEEINLSCLQIQGDSGATLRLYNNGSLINQGTSSISNITNFHNPANYNITCIYTSTTNFTQSSDTRWLYVNNLISQLSLGLRHRWDLNQSGGDSIGSLGFSDMSATFNSSGLIDYSWETSGTNSGGLSTLSFENYNGTLTVIFWLRNARLNTGGTGAFLTTSYSTGLIAGDFHIIQAGNRVDFNIYDDSLKSLSGVAIGNSWNMIGVRINKTTADFFMNNTKIGTINLNDSFGFSTHALSFAEYSGNPETGFPPAGYLYDLIFVYNRTLTDTEFDDMWNNGAGLIPVFDFFPAVSLNAPINNSNVTISNVGFNCSATDDFKISNLSIYINGERNLTEYDNSTYSEINQTLTFGEGFYNWTCYAVDNSSQDSWASSNFSLMINLPPSVNILTPSSLSVLTFDVNITANDTFGISYCSYNITRGASTEVGTTSINLVNFTEPATVSSYATYNLNIFCNDTYNNFNLTSKTIVISAPVVGNGGGGGGIVTLKEIITKLIPEISPEIVCKDFDIAFQEAWQKFKEGEKNLDSFKEMFKEFFNAIICRSSSSIISFISPIEEI